MFAANDNRNGQIPQSVAALVLNVGFCGEACLDVVVALPAALGSDGMGAMEARTDLLPPSGNEYFAVAGDDADRDGGSGIKSIHEHLQVWDVDEIRQLPGHNHILIFIIG